MRDSWIDREEFEELVGSFPEGKKTSRRRPLPHLPKELSPDGAPAPDSQAPAPDDSERDLAAEDLVRPSEEAISPELEIAEETTRDPVELISQETSRESDTPPAIESETAIEPIPDPIRETVFESVFEVIDEFTEIAREPTPETVFESVFEVIDEFTEIEAQTEDRDSPLADAEAAIKPDLVAPEVESDGSIFAGIHGGITTDPSEDTMVLREEVDDNETTFLESPVGDDDHGHFFSGEPNALGIPVDSPEVIEPAHSDFLRSGAFDHDFPESEPNEEPAENPDVPSPVVASEQSLFVDSGHETEDGSHEAEGLELDFGPEHDSDEEELVGPEDSLKTENNSDDEFGDIFTVIVEENQVVTEAPLRAPSFLDVSDALVETHRSPVSDREADRAVRSLAEARAKVDKSRLIRSTAVELTTTEAEAGEPSESPAPPGDTVSELPWVEEDFVFVPHGTFHERIVQFGNDMQKELGASELEVFDESGLLLYSSSGSIGSAATRGVQFCGISDQMKGMLGLGNHSATQVAVDNGGWQCLISGAGEAGNLCAVFTVAEPLDQRRVAVLREALADAINPERRSD